jgi:hypothetical protein
MTLKTKNQVCRTGSKETQLNQKVVEQIYLAGIPWIPTTPIEQVIQDAKELGVNPDIALDTAAELCEHGLEI